MTRATTLALSDIVASFLGSRSMVDIYSNGCKIQVAANVRSFALNAFVNGQNSFFSSWGLPYKSTHIYNKQKSPPAWTQKAYRPPHSKCSLCCSALGTPASPGMGYPPPPVTWMGVPPLPLVDQMGYPPTNGEQTDIPKYKYYLPSYYVRGR